VYQPAWSKDGEHVLYIRDNAVWIIGAGGGQPEKILDLLPERSDLFGFYGYIMYWDIMAWYQP